MLALGLLAATAVAAEPTAVERGEAVLHAAGGRGCHTETAKGAAAFAGGRGIKTPFGTFYATNITADRETGLGAWSLDDFVRAMRDGQAPDGSSYFPVFPYTSFTKMTDRDLGDLWAYLRAQPAVRRANRPHDVGIPFRWRWPLPAWKWLFFTPGPYLADSTKSPEWNRGAYLVNGPGHCGECHTPRGRLGASRGDMVLAGSTDGPEGESAPNLTSDAKTGIGEWRKEDVIYLLQTGLDPEGDGMQGLMAEEIERGYTHLPETDLAAIAAYLATVPPISNKVEAKKAK